MFDGDRFQTLADMYQARLRANPSDLLAMSGLIQVYTRWNRLEEALQWYQQRAALAASDAEAQYAVGVFIWSQLFQKGGGAEMAAFDPRPDPAEAEGEEDASAARRWATSWARSVCDWPISASRIWSAP